MIASGADTPDGELRRRLNYMIDELDVCQQASGDGYIGGVPGSRELWKAVAAGEERGDHRKWVPWYNLHKTFAGLRDAYLVAGNAKAREILVRFGDWCVGFTSRLSDEQMQQMLGHEHGGMNEVLADIYAITGDRRYLAPARRFNHQAMLDPLIRHQDQLTGMHANTQIPKVIGLERIATLTGDQEADSGARFFWENVTRNRTVAFGGNSVSEHFNDPHDFRGMLEHREGPETCNTYNMLRLTEQLFASGPSAAYADYYERALYNHILASIHPEHAGLRLLHAHPAGPLPGLLAAGPRVLVLRRHRHGESRPLRRVHLRAGPRWALRQPLHRLRTQVTRRSVSRCGRKPRFPTSRAPG